VIALAMHILNKLTKFEFVNTHVMLVLLLPWFTMSFVKP